MHTDLYFGLNGYGTYLLSPMVIHMCSIQWNLDYLNYLREGCLDNWKHVKSNFHIFICKALLNYSNKTYTCGQNTLQWLSELARSKTASKYTELIFMCTFVYENGSHTWRKSLIGGNTMYFFLGIKWPGLHILEHRKYNSTESHVQSK